MRKDKIIKSIMMYEDAIVLFDFFLNLKREMLTTHDLYLLAMVINIQKEIVEKNKESFEKRFPKLNKYRNAVFHYTQYWQPVQTYAKKFEFTGDLPQLIVECFHYIENEIIHIASRHITSNRELNYCFTGQI